MRLRRGDRRDAFGWHDLLVESLHGVGSRPGRLVLTVLGTVLGTAALVVTIGMAQTAAGQIDRQFDAVAATQVVIRPLTTNGNESGTAQALPWDAAGRVRTLAGVVAAGTDTKVDLGGADVTAVSLDDPSAPPAPQLPVLAVSPGFFDAVDATLAQGRVLGQTFEDRADAVVVLGPGAARQLGVDRVDVQPTVFLGDRPFTVVGLAGSLGRRPDLDDAVFLPQSTARALYALAAPDELQIRIDVRAGPIVGTQAPVALAPDAPDGFDVTVPPTASPVRQHVKADVNATFLALGAVALLVGGLGIANVTLLSVLERTGEIGLRRAVGARRHHVGLQFLTESSIVGLVGGMLGSALGVAAVVAVSAARHWAAVLDVRLVVVTALVGGVVGLVAGAYPASKAASVEPVTALRSAS